VNSPKPRRELGARIASNVRPRQTRSHSLADNSPNRESLSVVPQTTRANFLNLRTLSLLAFDSTLIAISALGRKDFDSFKSSYTAILAMFYRSLNYRLIPGQTIARIFCTSFIGAGKRSTAC